MTCILQVLLWFSLLFSHACKCNARPFFPARLSTKKNEKECLLYESMPAQPSLLTKLQVPKENGIRIQKEAKVADESNTQTDRENDEYVNINTKAANLEAESHVSAAWGAPETESWKLLFVRDYAPTEPKRRPPVNN